MLFSISLQTNLHRIESSSLALNSEEIFHELLSAYLEPADLEKYESGCFQSRKIWMIPVGNAWNPCATCSDVSAQRNSCGLSKMRICFVRNQPSKGQLPVNDISEYGPKMGSGGISVLGEPKWDLRLETRKV